MRDVKKTVWLLLRCVWSINTLLSTMVELVPSFRAASAMLHRSQRTDNDPEATESER